MITEKTRKGGRVLFDNQESHGPLYMYIGVKPLLSPKDLFPQIPLHLNSCEVKQVLGSESASTFDSDVKGHTEGFVGNLCVSGS